MDTIERVWPQHRELTAADRCDGCGARAWVRAVVGGTELLFCAHHGTKSMAALLDVADVVQDDRALVSEEPS